MTAIICELNPLHNGHKYLIDKAKEYGDGVILIMSGNFVQRGESACADKYFRADAAVKSGADLVVELPFPWCSASADYFARAGVCIAASLGADRLVFGSECGDAELINKAGAALSGGYDEELKQIQKSDPSTGAAAARNEIINKIVPGASDKLSGPNDILGVEYARRALSYGIECIPVKRTDAKSASELRALGATEASAYMPQPFPEFLSPEKLFDALRLAVRLDSCDTYAAEAEGGLGERIRKAAGKSADGSEMLSLSATKRYTDARIRRAALFMTLKVKREETEALPLFTTVLALNSKGAEILAKAKGSSSVTVITKPADTEKLPDEVRLQYETEMRADRLYAAISGRDEGYFMTRSPYFEK